MCPKTLTPRMKHTRVPGRYAGIFGGLLSKQSRYQAFTFFKAESGSRSQVESKTGKKWNGPNRKSNRLRNQKKYTYLVPP